MCQKPNVVPAPFKLWEDMQLPQGQKEVSVIFFLWQTRPRFCYVILLLLRLEPVFPSGKQNNNNNNLRESVTLKTCTNASLSSETSPKNWLFNVIRVHLIDLNIMHLFFHNSVITRVRLFRYRS